MGATLSHGRTSRTLWIAGSIATGALGTRWILETSIDRWVRRAVRRPPPA